MKENCKLTEIHLIYIYQSRAKPGAALQTPQSLIDCVSDPLVPTALWRRHTQTV